MQALLQNCLRDYNDDLMQQEDELSKKQQATTVTSSWECIDELSQGLEINWDQTEMTV